MVDTPDTSSSAPESAPQRAGGGGNLLSLAPLGLAIVPALMKFAGPADPESGARAGGQPTAQCVKSEEAPVHERYRGVKDVIDHLSHGTRVQIVRKRGTWQEIAFSAEGQAETGWVTSSHLEDCIDASTTASSVAPPRDPLRSSSRREATPAPQGNGNANGRPSVATGCRDGEMSVKFYDAGQALAALVSLPDGRRVLIDSGEQPGRGACSSCKEWSERFLNGLRSDVADKRLSMLWITHQHSDHAGNAPTILREFKVDNLVDNDTNLDSGIIQRTRAAAQARGVQLRVIDPDHRVVPLKNTNDVRFTPLLPAEWVTDCEDYPNQCSIGLRVDYCQSSVIFTGDAEETEEEALDAGGPVSLLQVGHHGSDTSSSEAWLSKTRPKYAVVSSGRRGEGTNSTYCHPRLSTVEALSQHVGGQKTKRIAAFDANVRCKDGTDNNWPTVPVSEHIWFTNRDGDVTLFTSGDGSFHE